MRIMIMRYWFSHVHFWGERDVWGSSVTVVLAWTAHFIHGSSAWAFPLLWSSYIFHRLINVTRIWPCLSNAVWRRCKCHITLMWNRESWNCWTNKRIMGWARSPRIVVWSLQTVTWGSISIWSWRRVPMQRNWHSLIQHVFCWIKMRPVLTGPRSCWENVGRIILIRNSRDVAQEKVEGISDGYNMLPPNSH